MLFGEKKRQCEVFPESEMLILKETGQTYRYKVKKIVEMMVN